MFEFFKYVGDEMRGVDHAEKVKKEQEARRDDRKVILSKGVRTAIYIFGLLYLVIALLSVSLLKKNHAGLDSYFMYPILSAVDLTVLIGVTLRTKKSEIAAIIGIIVFVALLFIFI